MKDDLGLIFGKGVIGGGGVGGGGRAEMPNVQPSFIVDKHQILSKSVLNILILCEKLSNFTITLVENGLSIPVRLM
jgi:hypothetical protein